MSKGPSSKKLYSINTSYARRAIRNRGLTQKALAGMVPCSRQMINRWLNGKSKISPRKLVRLAHILEVDPCALLESDDARTVSYLRDLINKKIENDRTLEDDLPLIDIPTLIKIADQLAYFGDKNSKVRFNPEEFDFPETDAEKQLKDLMG